VPIDKAAAPTQSFPQLSIAIVDIASAPTSTEVPTTAAEAQPPASLLLSVPRKKYSKRRTKTTKPTLAAFEGLAKVTNPPPNASAITAIPKKKYSRRRVKIKEFTLFPSLPTELRLKVWENAMPENRVVTVTVDRHSGYHRRDSTEFHNEGCFKSPGYALGHASLPLVFQINHESRSVGLKHYKLSFFEVFAGRPVYFDFTKDTLHLLNWETFHPRKKDGENLCKCANANDQVVQELQGKLRHLVVSDTKENRMAIQNAKYKALETLVMAPCKWQGCDNTGRSQEEYDAIRVSKWRRYFEEDRGDGANLPDISVQNATCIRNITNYPRKQKPGVEAAGSTGMPWPPRF
jgi:hypothetical protein